MLRTIAKNMIESRFFLGPVQYYYNNVVNTLNLLHVMISHDFKKLIFSSS